MVAYIIGLFFIVSGFMLWPYGFGSLVVGIIICLIKFFHKYNNINNFMWTKTFENSGVVNEFVNEINDKKIDYVEIQSKFIYYGEKQIYFKDFGIGDLTIANCRTLAETIKSKMNDSSNFKIVTMSKYTGGGGGHDRPIGLTQTANGNYTFDYGDSGPSTKVYGVKIVPYEKPKKSVNTKTKHSEWK